MAAARCPARREPAKSQLLLLCTAMHNRKNWLFAGSDDGGDRAAAMYTLIGTAKLNDIDPEAYLRYVLERIAEHPVNKIDALLPWNVATQLASLRLAA
jgi:IS66 C-terminal element